MGQFQKWQTQHFDTPELLGFGPPSSNVTWGKWPIDRFTFKEHQFYIVLYQKIRFIVVLTILNHRILWVFYFQTITSTIWICQVVGPRATSRIPSLRSQASNDSKKSMAFFWVNPTKHLEKPTDTLSFFSNRITCVFFWGVNLVNPRFFFGERGRWLVNKPSVHLAASLFCPQSTRMFSRDFEFHQ